MKLLLDTHILLWTLWNSPRLSSAARELIADPANTIYCSTVSVWEIELKHQAHPDRLLADAADIIRYCEKAGFFFLPVKNEHVLTLPLLEGKSGTMPHKDPFDRMLICQAIAERIAFYHA